VRSRFSSLTLTTGFHCDSISIVDWDDEQKWQELRCEEARFLMVLDQHNKVCMFGSKSRGSLSAAKVVVTLCMSVCLFVCLSVCL
jgi:hypothetical protein